VSGDPGGAEACAGSDQEAAPRDVFTIIHLIRALQ
jgi:hypothetical protein